MARIGKDIVKKIRGWFYENFTTPDKIRHRKHLGTRDYDRARAEALRRQEHYTRLAHAKLLDQTLDEAPIREGVVVTDHAGALYASPPVRLLTRKEAQAVLRVGEDRIAELVASGELPGVTIPGCGKRLFFTETAVRAVVHPASPEDGAASPVRLLTRGEAQAILLVSKHRIAELVASGELPAVTIGCGKRLLFTETAVRALVHPVKHAIRVAPPWGYS